LQVGDCLAKLSPTDPSVITVSVVDYAAAHAADRWRSMTPSPTSPISSALPGYPGTPGNSLMAT
jgi:hypothetical protein